MNDSSANTFMMTISIHILARVEVELESIPGTLRVRGEYTLGKTPAHHRTPHTYSHFHSQLEATQGSQLACRRKRVIGYDLFFAQRHQAVQQPANHF